MNGQQMERKPKGGARVFNRENILMVSACITLCAAIGFATAGFIVSPLGEIHDSVQWVTAEFLLYTGSALGIATYTYYGFKKMQTRIDRQIRYGRREPMDGYDPEGENYDPEDEPTNQP